MTLPFDFYIQHINYTGFLDYLLPTRIPYENLFPKFALIVTDVLIFGCPQKHDEPLSRAIF
jgi:hypothetical protein